MLRLLPKRRYYPPSYPTAADRLPAAAMGLAAALRRVDEQRTMLADDLVARIADRPQEALVPIEDGASHVELDDRLRPTSRSIAMVRTISRIAARRSAGLFTAIGGQMFASNGELLGDVLVGDGIIRHQRFEG